MFDKSDLMLQEMIDDDMFEQLIYDDNDHHIRKPYEFHKPVRTAQEEAYLRQQQRDGIYVPGRKKLKNKVYRRRDFSKQDLITLELIALSDFVSKRILAKLLKVKPNTARKRMLSLAEWGYLKRWQPIAGGQTLFGLTMKGRNKLIEEGGRIHADNIRIRREEPSITVIAHTLAIAMFISTQMLKGIEPSRMLNERYLFNNSYTGANSKDIVLDFHYARRKAVNSSDSWNSKISKSPILWIPCIDPSSDLPRLSHRPDLVFNYEDKRTDSISVSIAFEIELSNKSSERLRNVLSTYIHSRWIAYKYVVYVCGSDSVANKLKDVARSMNFPSGRLKIARVTDIDDIPYDGNFMMI